MENAEASLQKAREKAGLWDRLQKFVSDSIANSYDGVDKRELQLVLCDEIEK